MSKTKRFFAGFLAFVVTSLAFPAQMALAESKHFTGNGFTVDFTVNSSWDSGYSGSLAITNTGSQPIEDWVLTANANLGLGEHGASGAAVASKFSPNPYWRQKQGNTHTFDGRTFFDEFKFRLLHSPRAMCVRCSQTE